VGSFRFDDSKPGDVDADSQETEVVLAPYTMRMIGRQLPKNELKPEKLSRFIVPIVQPVSINEPGDFIVRMLSDRLQEAGVVH
jgi:hypothetical protein